MSERLDYPLLEVEETAKAVIASGGFIFQKWTCTGCGKRVTANNRNVLTIKGHCETCDTVTDLIQQGCNYIACMPCK